VKEFNRIFKDEMTELGKLIPEFPWEDRKFYGCWLAQTSYFVTYSTRILARTASRFNIGQDHFHKRYLIHLREEAGHEKLALNDLKGLNENIEMYPELPETSALYQSQYFWIEQQDPLSVFGYIFALEGLAVQCGDVVTERVQKTFGPKTVSFLKVHAGEDPDHLKDAFTAIFGLPEEKMSQIEKNFILSCRLYLGMLQAIKANIGSH
jgi:hypothetical protein